MGVIGLAFSFQSLESKLRISVGLVWDECRIILDQSRVSLLLRISLGWDPIGERVPRTRLRMVSYTRTRLRMVSHTTPLLKPFMLEGIVSTVLSQEIYGHESG